MFPEFNDTRLLEDFKENGYTTISILSNDELNELTLFFKSMNNEKHIGFYASLFDSDYESKKKIDLKIRSILEPKLSSVIKNYSAIVGSFVLKFSGQDGLVHPHQDWTFVDENKYQSLNIWVPLQDVNSMNGALYLLKNSHQLPFAYRGTNIVSAIVGAPHVSLKDMTPINLKKGEALIYDHKMIHASPPNLSTADRLAVAMVMIPQEAALIHIAKLNNHYLKFNIDREFFYKQQCINDNNMNMPEGYTPDEELVYHEFSFKEKELFPNSTWLQRLSRKINFS